MSGFSDVHNGGAYVRSEYALANTTAKTQTDTLFKSRASARGIANSAKLIIAYSGVLAAGETLTAAVQFRDAVDGAGAGAANYADPVAARVVATGAAGGSTETGTAEIDIDLGGAREFIQGRITVATSGSGTIAYNAILLFFGDQRGPATKSPVNLASPDLI